MSDRLAELQRQRSLLQEQAAWLDREIAAELARKQTAAAPPTETCPAPAPVPAPVAAERSDPDAILAQYREQSGDVHQDVKRGCFLYFAAAFAAVGLAVLALYLYSRGKH